MFGSAQELPRHVGLEGWPQTCAQQRSPTKARPAAHAAAWWLEGCWGMTGFCLEQRVELTLPMTPTEGPLAPSPEEGEAALSCSVPPLCLQLLGAVGLLQLWRWPCWVRS